MIKYLSSVVFVALFLLTGCGTTPEKERTEPPEVLYREAIADLQSGRYTAATKLFQEIDQKHPFSPWALRSQLVVIYTQFKKEEYDEAAAAAERFIRLHPRHASVAYAYYMRGLADFMRISDPLRDQNRTRQAAVALREVIARFPDSDYAQEAQRMLKLCNDRMAAQEVVIGRFYLDRDEFIAAANRFRRVVEHPDFSRTPYAEEALFSLVLTSLHLGMSEDARHYAAVLGHNFPQSMFYRQTRLMVDNQGTLSKDDLLALRSSLDEKSILKGFFEGIGPGVPGLTDQVMSPQRK
ncbi:MAG: outer membrane protein assembly factor BamD [Magnetococcales bacterium]|nr:outer membrane protein assembly factor BamD [Magnetococcales bacterium]